LHRASALPFPIGVVFCRPGSSDQRNAILRQASDGDGLVFFDDDFFPEATYLAEAEKLLSRHPDVVLATGKLIADGIHGPGIDPARGRALLGTYGPPANPEPLAPLYGAYGCNMVVRLAPVREHGIRFDEVLPLYGWQEDIDFSRQLAPHGRIVRCPGLTGVHLGIKRGRTSGVRFGYSQVANPVYLIRKGNMSVAFGGRRMLSNMLANAVRSMKPEPHVDRRGRCKGNALALVDLARGRLHPRRILELD
jgi:GT2 family glycosyltransferase